MIGRIVATLCRWRHQFSRNEWLTRLLNLPISTNTETEPGLVLIQIDGLGHSEIQRALQHNEMPFLQQLIDRKHYRLNRFYSGVPSTTAAVQGELFYGVKTSVPSFNFMQRDSKRLVRMYEPTTAIETEQRLKQLGHLALLEGGSCYADNFTGGATEAHFCPSSLGWGSPLREARPWVLFILILSNLYSFIRTGLLMLIEILLAVVDFVRGLIVGRDIWAELKFIPTRVVIVILLRELITIGAKIDIARGLPIIHLNFLGYDEQAHRRGPASLFAHWTLKGIDDAIARIWRTTRFATRRSYSVWIYSDHGQQHVLSYEKVNGKSFSEAATEVFNRYLDKPVSSQSSGRRGIQLQRIQMLGGERTQRFFARLLANISNGKSKVPDMPASALLSVAPLGPVAHLYYDQALTAQALRDLASALVTQANVPLVLYRDANGLVRAITQAEDVSLSGNPAAVLGTGHPDMNMACEDLLVLCQHPDAGVLIACGYRPGCQPISFAIENGAHGGWSSSETSAFALLPADVTPGAQYIEGSTVSIRPLDLRHAALTRLGL